MNVKKKKKTKSKSNLPFDSKQFPNFIRVIYLLVNKQTVVKICITGYLHRLILLKKSNDDFFWFMKDPNKAFRKNPIKRGRILKEDEVPNIIQRIHIFYNHDCLAEIDFRGRLEIIDTKDVKWTFHVEEVRGSIKVNF